MAEEKPAGGAKPLSLSERIKLLTEKAASAAAGVGSAPAPASGAVKVVPPKPQATPSTAAATKPVPAAAPSPAAAKPSPAAAPTAPASPRPPLPPASKPGPRPAASEEKPPAGSGSPAKQAGATVAVARPAPAAASPAKAVPGKPGAPAGSSAGEAPAQKLSLSERLKLLAQGKLAEAAAAPPARGDAGRAAPSATPAAAPKPAPSGPGGTALASDRIAQRLRGEKAAPGAAKAAPAMPGTATPKKPEKEPVPPPPAPPRTYTPYVDDAIFERLPKNVQRIILEAGNEEGVTPVRDLLRRLEDAELAGEEELVVGFAENVMSVLRHRFFLDDDVERSIFVEPGGDLSLRSGDGDVKVRGKCWEFFFLYRWRRPLGRTRAELRASAQEMVDEVFTFSVDDTSVCKMAVDEPVSFEGKDAYYMECSLESGGWCELRFEAASVFTDGRVLVVTFEPRVVRGKDVPPPKTLSPREFVALLNKSRRRG